MNTENRITLNHGSGGRLMHRLIEEVFYKYFSNDILLKQKDAAEIALYGDNLAFTTDSFVVEPIFFPGGDIGKLAICGTVNDLAVSGANPKYLSASFIIEEGFLREDLERIVQSMAREAQNAGIQIVTGDTKVVNKGKCDKIFITTSGIGQFERRPGENHQMTSLMPGDKIIINGGIAEHGMAVLCAREQMSFRTDIISDCACLNHLIRPLQQFGHQVKFMRDPTRGGLATVLCEVAKSMHVGLEVFEEEIPVSDEVSGICDLLGFDPIYVANEGKVVMIVADAIAEHVIDVLRTNILGEKSVVIGEVTDAHPSKVVMQTAIGGRRIVDMLAGDQLPRIC